MWVPISIKANVFNFLFQSYFEKTLGTEVMVRLSWGGRGRPGPGRGEVPCKCHQRICSRREESPDMWKQLSAPHLPWQGLPPWQIQGIPWLCQRTDGKIDLGMLSKWHWGKIEGGIQPGRGEATTGCQLLVGPLYMAGQIHWDIGEQWDDAKGRQNLMS